MVGARLVLPGPELDGPSIYRLLEQQAVTVTAAVPTVLLGLLEYMEKERVRPSTLHKVIVGGAACPPNMMETYEDKYDITVGWVPTFWVYVYMFGCSLGVSQDAYISRSHSMRISLFLTGVSHVGYD